MLYFYIKQCLQKLYEEKILFKDYLKSLQKYEKIWSKISKVGKQIIKIKIILIFFYMTILSN